MSDFQSRIGNLTSRQARAAARKPTVVAAPVVPASTGEYPTDLLKLKKDELVVMADLVGVSVSGKTKAELIVAIEAA